MNTPEPSQPVGSQRRFFSRTLVSWHAMGLLMLPGLFMPLCKGCSNEVRYPLDCFATSVDWGNVAMLVFTFGMPLVLAWLLTVVAIFRSCILWMVSFWLQIVLLLVLLLLIAVPEWYREFESGSAKGITRTLLGSLPVVVAIPWWIGTPIRRRRWTQAWGRLQQLTVLATWIALNLMCLFKSVLLVGYWYTSAVMVATLFVAEMSKGRLAHDLWAPDEPVERFQFSLRRMFIWMTLLPLVPAYYRALDWVLEAIF